MDDNSICVIHVLGKVVKGGVESVVFNYYRAIDRRKVRFDFIIDRDSPCEIPNDIKELGCKIYKVTPHTHLSKYISELKKIFKGYTIVHSHMNSLSVFTLFAAKQAAVPIRIAHSHSTSGKGEVKRNIIKYILKPFSRLFPTKLCACSEYAGRWLFGNHVFDKSKVTVIRNAIDTSKFKFNPQVRERTRKRLNIDNKIVIGHVGRFVTQKNHSFLLDIFAKYHSRNSNSVLLLIGDGELKSNMEKKSYILGLTDSIKFLGTRNDMNELYQAMDVFVLPSLYEGLAVVRVEALSAGLPTIVSAGQTTEIDVYDECFLPIDDTTVWVNAIDDKLSKVVNRERISESMCEKWHITNEVSNLMCVYEEELNRIDYFNNCDFCYETDECHSAKMYSDFK